MAVLARLWFHFCSASGWVLAERTGVEGQGCWEMFSPTPTSFKQDSRNLTSEDLRMSHRRVWNGHKNTPPRGVESTIDQFGRGRADFRLESSTSGKQIPGAVMS